LNGGDTVAYIILTYALRNSRKPQNSSVRTLHNVAKIQTG